MPVQGVNLDQAGNLVVAGFSARELTVPVLREVVVELMQKMRYDNARYFILDLKGVEFLSSGCIGCLVEFLQDLEHVCGRVVLANVCDNVAFLFKVTRLDSVFRLYQDLNAAKANVAFK